MGKDMGGANGGLLYQRHCKGVKIINCAPGHVEDRLTARKQH